MRLVKNTKPNEQSNSVNYWSWHKIILPSTMILYYTINGRRTKDREEWIKWCEEYTNDEWFVNANSYFFFKDEDDAILFKLTWI